MASGDGTKVGGVYAEVKVETDGAEQQLPRIKAEMVELTAAFDRGAVSGDRYKQAMAELQATQGRLERQLRATTNSVATVGTSAGISGNKLMVLGQGLDDLQYVGEQGLRPIIGNLMQISAVAGIAAIGVGILINHWDDLLDAFDLKGVETETEEMARLEKATKRTADETARLNKLKREQSEIADLRQSESREQRESGSLVKEALEEGPFNSIVKGLVESRTSERVKQGGKAVDLLPEEEERIATLQRRLRVAQAAGLDLTGRQSRIVDEAIKAIHEAARDRDVHQAEKDVANAQHDPNMLRALIGEVKANPGAFPPELQAKLERATPEGMKAEKDREAGFGETAGATEELDRSNKKYLDRKKRLREQAIEEEARDNERALEEGNQRYKQARARRSKRAEELADPMQDRLAAEKLRGGAIDKGRIKEELERQGLDEDEADTYAGLVLGKFESALKESIRKRAAETGATIDDAARDVLKDIDEREKRERRREEKAHRGEGGQFAGLEDFNRRIQLAAGKSFERPGGIPGAAPAGGNVAANGPGPGMGLDKQAIANAEKDAMKTSEAILGQLVDATKKLPEQIGQSVGRAIKSGHFAAWIG